MFIKVLLWIFCSSSVFADDQRYVFYQVQEDDHLGEILREFGYTRNLWGERGWVSRVKDLNPWLFLRGGDYLPVGVYLKVPIREGFDILALGDKIRTKAPAPVAQFSAARDRNYEIALLESDGKNEFKKIGYPMKLVQSDGETATFTLDQMDAAQLQEAALKPIPHFKDEFYAETAVVQAQTLEGQTIEKIEYRPWRLRSHFFANGFAGAQFVAIDSEAPPDGDVQLSPSSGALGVVNLGIYFTDRLSAFGQFRTEYLAFKAPEGASLSGATQVTPHLGLGVSYQLTSKWLATVLAKYRRDIFVSAASATELTIVPLYRPQVNISAQLLLWKRAAHGVSGRVALLSFLPRTTASIQLELSFGFLLEAIYKLKLNELNDFEISAYYKNRSQKVTPNTDTFSVLGLGVRYGWN